MSGSTATETQRTRRLLAGVSVLALFLALLLGLEGACKKKKGSLTAAVPARAKVRHTAAGTTHTLDALPIAERARLGRAGAVASHSGVPQFAWTAGV